jgi:hypothetical protein
MRVTQQMGVFRQPERRYSLNGILLIKSRRIGEVIKRSEVACLIYGFLKREGLSPSG